MHQTPTNIDFQAGQILLFDKPLDWTSFDLVNKVRWLIRNQLKVKKIKVGHAGTLDPKATGLMLLCTGKATKQIDLLQAGEKEYIATIKLGATTPSFDLETEEDSTASTDHITNDLIEQALTNFIGEIDQIPPIFSAIKVNGKRAFSYARSGEELELKARKITIRSISIEKAEIPFLVIRIRCSKGTYIRSIARDLGIALNCGAYLVALERTVIGEYTLEKAWNIENFEKMIQEM